MGKKTLPIILSSILLASFFVPYIEWEDYTMSGFDFVVSSLTPEIKYLLLIIPVSALFLLFDLFYIDKRDNRKGILSKLPLFALLFLFILFYTSTDTRNSLGTLNPFKFFCMGAWIALGASILLAFNRKTAPQYSN